MEVPSYFDIDRLFVRSTVVRDIAEPLRSFDRTTPSELVRAAMIAHNCEVVGVRESGWIDGHVLRSDLGPNACGLYARPLAEAVILADTASLVEVIRTLSQCPWAFVRILGQVGGIVTRADLQDPPVRMWLFGLITSMEMRFQRLIEEQFTDESWMQYLSDARLAKARSMIEERQRRSQNPTLLDCLQFSDKGQIIARDEALRVRAGFVSRRRADEVIKRLEALRNNLAHAQNIVDSDWDTIVGLAENLTKVLGLAL